MSNINIGNLAQDTEFRNRFGRRYVQANAATAILQRSFKRLTKLVTPAKADDHANFFAQPKGKSNREKFRVYAGYVVGGFAIATAVIIYLIWSPRAGAITVSTDGSSDYESARVIDKLEAAAHQGHNNLHEQAHKLVKSERFQWPYSSTKSATQPREPMFKVPAGAAAPRVTDYSKDPLIRSQSNLQSPPKVTGVNSEVAWRVQQANEAEYRQTQELQSENHAKQLERERENASIKAGKTYRPILAYVDGLGAASDMNYEDSVASTMSWRQKMTAARPDDVINHRYDHMAVSVILEEQSAGFQLEIHHAVTTFLRQMNHLQVGYTKKAESFIGGAHHLSLDVPQVSLFPVVSRYVEGFKSLNSFSPNQDWLIQLDADSYLFMENINIFLSKYDPNQAHFFHNFDIVTQEASHFNRAAPPTNHFPVSIMSRRALELFVASDYQQCFLLNKYMQGSVETMLVKCMKEAGITVEKSALLHTSEPAHDFAWPLDSCKRPLSISQLSEEQMQYLFKTRPQAKVASDGSAYKWDALVTYSTVFHHTFGNSKPTAGLDRHTASTSHSVETSSGAECAKVCRGEASCVSWTYEMPKCYTSDSIGVAIRRPGVVAGIMNDRYNCLVPDPEL